MVLPSGFGVIKTGPVDGVGATIVQATSYGIDGGKTIVNGTAYDITKGKTLVDGTGRDISFGSSVGSLAVGESVYLRENGTLAECIIVHQGNPATYLYDSSCTGTWLLRKDSYISKRWDDLRNNYADSEIHDYLNNTFINIFDSTIQGIILQAKIPYCIISGGSTIKSGSDGLSTKAFLLSAHECGLQYIEDDNYIPEDGSKLSYFSYGITTDANNKRIAYMNGSSSYWFLRSPWINKSTKPVMYISNNGTYGYCNVTQTGWHIRPTFIISSDANINSEYEVVG